jgi:lauroyl/myristoyl acyltransferase
MDRLRRHRALNPRTVQVIDALLGPLPLPAKAEIARQVATTDLRNRCLNRLVPLVSLGSLAHLIRCVDVRSLEEARAGNKGALVISWHHGARAAVGPALHQLGMRALLFARRSWQPTVAPDSGPDAARIDFLAVGEPRDRVMHLKRALEYLEGGGLVSIVVDGGQGTAALEIPFVGRRLSLRRGPAVLARLTGAPMIPVVATWASDGAIEFRSFEPLPVPPPGGLDAQEWDRVALTEAVRFFEKVIHATPGQLRAGFVRKYWRAPVT